VRLTILRAALCLPLLLSLWACGKKIGDECKTAIDCNEEDDSRSCDISQPGGYCTVEGCDEKSCPSEAACVRFFPHLYLDQSVKCDPAANDACAPQDLCLDAGYCAPRSSELRRCVLKCGDNGDCRSGYECRLSGALGSMALTGKPGSKVKFCAPRER
jgi:hypothetical protein